MSESEDIELAKLQTHCLLVAAAAEDEARFNRDQGSHLLRWSVTTCMTINAGALVATMNVDKFDQGSQFWAGIWFLIGTILSIIMAGLLATVFLKTGRSYSKTAFDLRRIAEAGDMQAFSELSGKKLEKEGAKGGFAFFSLMLAVLAFVIGCGILIDGAP